LLRHGESAGNARHVFAVRSFDPPKTDAGVEQASMQAESLCSAGVTAIHASPLLRARQTAAFASERCGLPVTYSDALWEVDVGDLDGRSVDQENLAIFRAVLDEWEAGSWDACLSGGETFTAVRARFRAFLDGALAGAEGPVLVVGHGVLFMVVLWAFCENRRPTLFENYMGRGHLSILSVEDGQCRLVEFNLAPGADLRRVQSPADGSDGEEQ
jgi:broad specificity phosphatase PhoE